MPQRPWVICNEIPRTDISRYWIGRSGGDHCKPPAHRVSNGLASAGGIATVNAHE